MNEAIILVAKHAAAAYATAPFDPYGLLAAMPWLLLLLDAQASVTYANPATLAGWSLAPALLVGRPLFAALPREQCPALHLLFASPVPAQGECFLPHCAQWLALSTVQLAPGRALYAQDITEWRRTSKPTCWLAPKAWHDRVRLLRVLTMLEQDTQIIISLP